MENDFISSFNPYKEMGIESTEDNAGDSFLENSALIPYNQVGNAANNESNSEAQKNDRILNKAQTKLALHNRRQKALQLRAAGYGVVAIAEELGVSIGTVSVDIKKALAEIPKQAADELREQELTKLDNYLKYLDDKIKQGNVRAIETAIKASERRAKMLGLDMPIQIEQKTLVSYEPQVLDMLNEAKLVIESEQGDSYDY